MRNSLILACVILAGCASNQDPGYQGNIQILAATKGQALDGTPCAVIKGNQRWDMVTPDVVPVGAPDADLRVACRRPGFRDSEVVYRPSPYSYAGSPSSYGGFYPNVGIGVAGGSGGGSGVGIGLNFPVGGGAPAGPVGGFPTSITVEMTPQ